MCFSKLGCFNNYFLHCIHFNRSINYYVRNIFNILTIILPFYSLIKFYLNFSLSLNSSTILNEALILRSKEEMLYIDRETKMLNSCFESKSWIQVIISAPLSLKNLIITFIHKEIVTKNDV